ncbi:MAG: hypothetical protein QOG22_3697 [Pseudonocardiales bacterium]|nr:hypothetical protein [Pseudonocardiales bacterium]
MSGDRAALTGLERNFTWLWFTDPSTRAPGRRQAADPSRGRPLDLLYETLVSGVGDQILVVRCPRPGTDARAKFDLLRAIGTQYLRTTR